jgi:hypothetical protein
MLPSHLLHVGFFLGWFSLCSSETPVYIRTTRRNIPGDVQLPWEHCMMSGLSSKHLVMVYLACRQSRDRPARPQTGTEKSRKLTSTTRIIQRFKIYETAFVVCTYLKYVTNVVCLGIRIRLSQESESEPNMFRLCTVGIQTRLCLETLRCCFITVHWYRWQQLRPYNSSVSLRNPRKKKSHRPVCRQDQPHVINNKLILTPWL